jgi:K+-sensing histidine kinase KdpD
VSEQITIRKGGHDIAEIEKEMTALRDQLDAVTAERDALANWKQQQLAVEVPNEQHHTEPNASSLSHLLGDLNTAIESMEAKITDLQMQLDASCDAELLRQIRAENAELRTALRNLLSMYDGIDQQDEPGQFAAEARRLAYPRAEEKP